MTKDHYRRMYKQKRIALSEQERGVFDESICAGLIALDWSNLHAVHVYMPIAKLNEPNPFSFVNLLRSQFPQTALIVSKSDFQNSQMRHYVWDASTVFEENSWGIMEPVDGISVDETAIDVVLVPLLAADVRGNRVGYGKGFYDRFLRGCKPDVQKIGLSYFEPVEAIDDVAPWDVPVDILITPFKTYQF